MVKSSLCVALAAARRRAQPHSKAEAVSAEHNSVWQPAHRGFSRKKVQLPSPVTCLMPARPKLCGLDHNSVLACIGRPEASTNLRSFAERRGRLPASRSTELLGPPSQATQVLCLIGKIRIYRADSAVPERSLP